MAFRRGAAACFASLAFALAQPALAQSVATEAQIYGAVLRHLLGGLKGEQVFVVAGDTVSLKEAYARMGSLLFEVPRDLEDRLAEVPAPLREDILRKDATSQAIALPTRGLPGNVRLKFVPRFELDGFFPAGKPADWHRFEAKYDNARGVLELSRIGFDAERRTALVFVSKSCPGLCGFGLYLLLEQQGSDPWKVAKTWQVWIS
jgi:hypothetical protein